MKKFTTKDVIALVIWVLPAVYLLRIYPSLQQTVPLHYGVDGQPDRYGDRSEFLLATLVIMGVAAIMYLLMKFLPSIDPKRTAKYSSGTFKQLALVLLVFLTIINMAIMYAVTHEGFQMNKMILPLVGLLLAYIGNIMHSLKPNYFVGIRTPWTLEDEDTWRKTHQLGGKLWLAGGIAVAVLSLLLPIDIAPYVFMVVVVIMALIPIVYSYIYFKKHHTTH